MDKHKNNQILSKNNNENEIDISYDDVKIIRESDIDYTEINYLNNNEVSVDEINNIQNDSNLSNIK